MSTSLGFAVEREEPAGLLRPGSVEEAVHWALLYADIFDFPLTRDEIFTFLLAPGGSRAEVEAAIDATLRDGRELETDGTFFYLRGRAETVAVRRTRNLAAEATWQRARSYARLIWALPFVRMMAVTGALAADNVQPDNDIDFLIVTEPGRLWMTRGMVILLCKLARWRGDTLCPNYLISSAALQLHRRDLYAAHELAQMVPLHGGGMAERLWSENAWYRSFLPNASSGGSAGVDDTLPRPLAALKALAEWALRLPPGDVIERWERERKVARLSRQASLDGSETVFTADVCKGHYQGHGSRIMRLFASRVAELSGARERPL